MTGKLPQKIALFSAIPLNKDEFDNDLSKPSPNGDYVKAILTRDGEYRPVIAWQIYEPIANFILEKLGQLHSFHVDIHLRATAYKFKEQLGNYQVAIVLAHWKGAYLLASDIIFPRELAFQLLNDNSDEIDYLRQLIGFDKLNAIAVGFNQDANAELTKLLREAFNELINEYDLAGIDGWEDDIQNQKARNRDYLVQVFGRNLCPGNRIEFVDGLVSAQGFVDCVPDSYNGVLDITMCYSVILANLLNWKRRNCICVSNKNELTPSFQLTRLVAICQLMSKKQLDFLTALSQVLNIIDELY